MVLAAGLGTRLRPLTDELPKPLVPVGDRPVLAHIAELLHRVGVERLVVNTHHRADAFTPQLLGLLPVPCRVLHEPTILGTAGGVANAREALGEGDVLVCNGDILADVDLPRLLAEHRRSGAVATLAVCAPTGAAERGTVGLDRVGRVVRLRQERYGEERSSADFVGIQVVAPELRRRLPPSGCLVGDGYQPALRAGLEVRAVDAAAAWQDIGNLQGYLRANLTWLARHGGPRFVAASAQVAPAVDVRRSLVGSEARVEGTGVLRECVVWPGAVARAPLERAVVTRQSGTVRLR